MYIKRIEYEYDPHRNPLMLDMVSCASTRIFSKVIDSIKPFPNKYIVNLYRALHVCFFVLNLQKYYKTLNQETAFKNTTECSVYGQRKASMKCVLA